MEEEVGGDCCAVVMGGSCDGVGWGLVPGGTLGGLGCPGNPGPAAALHPKSKRQTILLMQSCILKYYRYCTRWTLLLMDIGCVPL